MQEGGRAVNLRNSLLKSARGKAGKAAYALVRTDDPATPYRIEPAMGQSGIIAVLCDDPLITLRWARPLSPTGADGGPIIQQGNNNP